MKRNFDIGLIELAMRALERTRQAVARHGDRLVINDVAMGLVDDYGCSESTALRHVRLALDVLGVHYGKGASRQVIEQRRQDAAQAGQQRAKAKGWPNGRPGPRGARCEHRGAAA